MTGVDPIEAFKARCWARAWLWGVGEIDDLADAVDELQESALVEAIGQEAAQIIMAEAFRPYRDEPPTEIEPAVSRGTPASTIEALCYELRSGLARLDRSANRDRLRRCDPDAMREIGHRLLNMHALSKGARADWPAADVAKLLSRWKALQ